MSILDNPITPDEAKYLAETVALNAIKMSRKQSLRDHIATSVSDGDGKFFDRLLNDIITKDYESIGIAIRARVIAHAAAGQGVRVDHIIEDVIEDRAKHHLDLSEADAVDELEEYEQRHGPLDTHTYNCALSALKDLLP